MFESVEEDGQNSVQKHGWALVENWRIKEHRESRRGAWFRGGVPTGRRATGSTLSVITPVSQNPMTSPTPTTKPLPIPEVQTGNVQVGYVIVTPDSGTNTPTASVTYGWLQGDGDLLSKAGVLATPLTTSASVVVEFVPSINRNLGVMIVNPNAAANTITLTLKDETGTVVGSPVNLTLDPYKQIARWVSELLPDAIGASLHLNTSAAEWYSKALSRNPPAEKRYRVEDALKRVRGY